jgi:DNA-binding transcriptional ArsR family regulator
VPLQRLTSDSIEAYGTEGLSLRTLRNLRIHVRIMRKLIHALFSKGRADLLSALVLHPDREWFLSDLANHLGVSPSSLQRELARLTEAEMLIRRTEGKRVYYKLESACPILPELQGLFLKTSGLVDVVFEALRSQRKNIEVAAIFGSVARGEELATSDVDLLVIGNVGLSDLSSALKNAEAKLLREIQVFVYSPKEFWHKFEGKEHFLTSVLNGPLLNVIGEINGYMEAARK